MKQYRVSLWVENQGDIPDVDFQFQMVGAVPTFSQLVMAAFFLADKHYVPLVRVEEWDGNQWVVLFETTRVTLSGTSDVWFSSMGSWICSHCGVINSSNNKDVRVCWRCGYERCSR